MPLRIKLPLFFVVVYLLSMVSLTLFTLAVVKELLINYTYEYMEYQLKPALEFYKNLHKEPSSYISSLASDVVSRDVASIVVDEKVRIIHKEPFLDEEELNISEKDLELLLKSEKGVWNEYAFVVKKMGDYRLILLGKLEKIEDIQRKLVLFVVVFTLLISVLIVFVFTLFTVRMLRPLEYLTYISREIYKGNMDVRIDRAESKDEFGVLQRAYADMIEKLRKTFNWQREFIGGLTHELKTPLTYIKGQLELISMGVYKDEDKIKEVLKKMYVQANKMEKLISHLILLMRLESGMPIKLSPINLSELFAEIDEEYEFIKSTHNFKVEYPERDVIILADKDYLRIAIGNLIENSYKYTPEGGTIRLYYTDNCIVVEDTGRGIKDTKNVFERFYREAEDKEGFGLGLSIVKAIADAHRFEIYVDSQVGKGTRVRLCVNPL